MMKNIVTIIYNKFSMYCNLQFKASNVMGKDGNWKLCRQINSESVKLWLV